MTRWGVLLLGLLALPLEGKELACRPFEGLAPLLEPGTLLLIGEMHGTEQGPAFVRDAVCQALRAGRRVTLGLEIPREESERLGLYLSSGGSAASRAALLRSPFWADAYQDGRRSRAMLALIEDLRVWKKAGEPVRTVLIDTTAFTDGGDRDRKMAAAVKQAMDPEPRDVFLVLTGNLHNRRVKGTPWNPNVEPMGLLLSRLAPNRKTVSLDMAYAPGTAWTCTGTEASSCAERKVGGRDKTPRTGIELFAAPDENGYHGLYHVGELKASPPASRP